MAPPLRRVFTSAVSLACAALVARTSQADMKPVEEWERQPASRRSGVQIGASLGAGIVSIAGFPNDPETLGLASAYTETGVHPGGWFTLWIGGALADWLAVGVGGGGGSMIGLEGREVTTGAFLFHVEGFPLITFGGRLRDLGVWLDAGTGPVTVEDTRSKTTLVEAGAASLVGGGVFYEGLRFWRIGAGPFLAANYMWSESVRRPAVYLGFRTALYTGVFGK